MLKLARLHVKENFHLSVAIPARITVLSWEHPLSRREPRSGSQFFSSHEQLDHLLSKRPTSTMVMQELIRVRQFHFSILPMSRYMTLSELLHLSEPPSLICKMRIIMVPSSLSSERTNEDRVYKVRSIQQQQRPLFPVEGNTISSNGAGVFYHPLRTKSKREKWSLQKMILQCRSKEPLRMTY